MHRDGRTRRTTDSSPGPRNNLSHIAAAGARGHMAELLFPAFADAYRLLAPFAEAVLRVVTGLILVPHGLRAAFGFFPDTGMPINSLKLLGDAVAAAGYRPGLFWATVVVATELIGGPMLALRAAHAAGKRCDLHSARAVRGRTLARRLVLEHIGNRIPAAVGSLRALFPGQRGRGDFGGPADRVGVLMASRMPARCGSTTERAKAGGVERCQVGRFRDALSDQFCHRLSRGGRVEDAPDAVPGRDIGTLGPGHPSDQREPILRNGTKAGLSGDDPFRTERR